MNQWASGGCLLKDFYDIFNIPYPTYEEITKAINRLSEIVSNYLSYVASTTNGNKKNKIEEYFKLLLVDIFGELGVSVKLAGEGYISYSLRGIRAVFDLLFAGLFTVSSWTEGSAEDDEGINPMGEAFFSGYWGKLKVLSLDSLVVSEIEFGEDGKRATTELQELSDKFYPDIISGFDFDKEKINSKIERKIKQLLKNSLEEFFINLLKVEGTIWKDAAKEILGNKEKFYQVLIRQDQVSLRTCEEHKNKMMQELKGKLGIDGELTEQLMQKISSLTFTEPVSNEEEYRLCDYCENKATTYGIYSRPDTKAMVKLIKLQLNDNELKEINSCIKESFKMIGKNTKETYFGDIIYSELYSKLNDYVHSNIAEEPSVEEWFYNFYVPTIIVLQCILSRPLWTHSKKDDR